MIRRALAAVLSLTQTHRHFVVNFLLPVGLSLATCGALAGWVAEHDARVRENDAAEGERHYAARTMELLNANLESISRAYIREADSLKALSDGVTVTRTQYRPVHDTLLLEMERAHSQVVDLLPHLPEFVARADSAMNACTEFQEQATTEQHVADSLIAALRHKSELLERAAPWKPPRWTAEGEVLYDPLHDAPTADASIALRVVGGWSVAARAEQRFAPGESPQLLIGVRKTF